MSYMNLVNAADELKNLLMIIIKALFMDYISYVAKKTTLTDLQYFQTYYKVHLTQTQIK